MKARESGLWCQPPSESESPRSRDSDIGKQEGVGVLTQQRGQTRPPLTCSSWTLSGLVMPACGEPPALRGSHLSAHLTQGHPPGRGPPPLPGRRQPPGQKYPPGQKECFPTVWAPLSTVKLTINACIPASSCLLTCRVPSSSGVPCPGVER